MLGMLGDKNKMMTTIMGRLGSESSEVEGPKEDSSAGLEASMHKFISCVHAKDAKGCVSALGDFLEMHEDDDADEESGEGHL